MAETQMDFQCYLATYELRRPDELPEGDRKSIFDSSVVRRLVQIGRGKLVRPKRKTMDMAVGLLLKTRMPKWTATKEGQMKAIVGSDATIAKELDPVAEELADLERNVLAISRHIGLLCMPCQEFYRADLGDGFYHESILDWFRLAQWIQQMFGSARQTQTNFESPVGSLSIFVSFKSDQTHSIQIRPDRTRDALIYHAAQMIAGGTTFQTCENCGTPFLGGGTGRGGAKKRADARFCSDKCRSSYHNELRRKAARKAKL
jgi:hypothetical protein